MTLDAIKELFGTMLEQERVARDIYANTLKRAKNQKVKETLAVLVRDEQRHIRNAEEILRILG